MNQICKEESHYSDLYDLMTIEECLQSVKFWRKASQEMSKDKKFKNMSNAEKAKAKTISLNFTLYGIKGERYLKKPSTIREWMERDRKCDEKLASVQDPQNIRCPNCSKLMDCTLKDLYTLSDNPLRVLFFFECPSCKKRKGIFDNGEEYVSKPHYCPKCNKVMSRSHKKEGNVVMTENLCSSCGFIETVIDDFDKDQAEWEEKEKRNKDLLKKYRTQFCLSAAEGQEYSESIFTIKSLAELVEKAKQKQNDPDYQKVEKLKKLSVVELEKFLSEALQKEKYIKLSFDKPEIDEHVVVPFTVQDFDSSRKDNDSKYKFQRVIKKALDNTNWRLMSDGVSYRLGYLYGRLKGYEREEDMLKIIKSSVD